MKTLLYLIPMFMTFDVMAYKPPKDENTVVINNNYITKEYYDITNVTNRVTEIHETIEKYYIEQSKGIALAVSMTQHHFDYNTNDWQGAFGIGHYHGSNAASLGFAKKTHDGQALISGAVGQERNRSAFSFGINWRW